MPLRAIRLARNWISKVPSEQVSSGNGGCLTPTRRPLTRVNIFYGLISGDASAPHRVRRYCNVALQGMIYKLRLETAYQLLPYVPKCLDYCPCFTRNPGRAAGV